MAEAFLQVLLDNLSSLIKGEIGLILGVDDEMKKLASTLTTIQAVLEDAEDKQVESKPIRNWLRKLNNLAFEIDDILDECATEVSIMQHKNRKWSLDSLKKILYRHKIGRRMREVAGKLDAVAAEREKFHFREMVLEGRQSKFAATRETISIINEPDTIYGRDDERDEIVDILVNQVKDFERLSVLAIVGIGGLGKTTLAQLVFNDPQVSEHFETKLWVCVSDNFDLKTLVKAMLESATKRTGIASDSAQLDTLQHQLRESLIQKRYLLVLDDVWNEDQEKWAMLKNVLACGSKGASIVVTTRLKKVADIMGTLPAIYLKGLSDEHCWLLFKKRAFGEEIKEYSKLEPVGRQIVKKCGGVPLAAKALGGLLRFKRTEKEWLYIKESEIWNLPPEESLILPALRLSYHHLPLRLRQCFAYCAVFPKDSQIEKQELIFLWIAHKCISSNGIMEVEDVGNEVLHELVLRSLLQERRIYDGYSIFEMHDLVHDLAQSVMENKVVGAEAEERSDRSAPNNNRIRHVVLRRDNYYVAFPTSIRNEADICFTLMNFNRVRMLKARNMNINELPSAIGNLKHLRSLDLSHNNFCTLPNSMCRLWNLQILILDSCFKLADLPKHMRYVRDLRHLLMNYCPSLSKMPSKIMELTSLKTLSVFIVDHERGNQLGGLHSLNLGGKLEIRHLERVKSQMDAKNAGLVEKTNLRDLALRWEGGEGASSSQSNMDEEVLEALVPHPSLEILKIYGFNGRFLPDWMRNSAMLKLVRIEMKYCANCSHLSSLADLPCLKFLRLKSFANLEYIVEDDVQSLPPVVRTKFLSLEELVLKDLSGLKLLSKEKMRESFPNLQKLEFEACDMLMLPPLPSLKNLKGHCSQLTLSSFPEFDNLTFLDIGVEENTCIPNRIIENLHKLVALDLRYAHEQCLQVESLRGLKSLETLSLVECQAMTCLPHAWLRQLTDLECIVLSDSPKLVELPEGIKFLHSLKHLRLDRLESMVRLPEVIQHISQLRKLELWNLPKLSSLPDWFGNITSLQKLTILNCPQLASLPSSIQGMTNLQLLLVSDCSPELHRRYEKEKGEDWHKIAHIPHVSITIGFD